jgi:hypothetical protein
MKFLDISSLICFMIFLLCPVIIAAQPLPDGTIKMGMTSRGIVKRNINADPHSLEAFMQDTLFTSY